jgi:hypothetical protein
LDADDRLDEENQKNILDSKEQLEEGIIYYAWIMNVIREDEIDVFPQLRIFQKNPLIRYRGRAHNMLEYPREGFKIEESPILIKHRGYKNPAVVEQKRRRTFRLLQMDLEENPDDARPHAYLGLHYWVRKEKDKAKAHLNLARKKLEPQIDKKPWGLFQAYPILIRMSVEEGDTETALDFFESFQSIVRGNPLLEPHVTALAEELDLWNDILIRNSLRAKQYLSPALRGL